MNGSLYTPGNPNEHLQQKRYDGDARRYPTQQIYPLGELREITVARSKPYG
ncbi:hypothetical protein [Brasilonema sp. UFV-L1]|uniref:hypothetical protein n=1 Tax=Brasilonema sp. UFV-L1 TaxID=2234130 RepID=UPI00145CEF68|nr:hypothetical protein [Brasilonema sp. UFV-L1]